MNVYFGGDFGEIYLDCMIKTEDEEFCRGVVRAVKESTKGVYTYGSRPRFHLVLPDIEYVGRILIDEKRDRIVIVLQHQTHTVFLHFARNGDGFVLERAELLNVDIAAMHGEYPPF